MTVIVWSTFIIFPGTYEYSFYYRFEDKTIHSFVHPFTYVKNIIYLLSLLPHLLHIVPTYLIECVDIVREKREIKQNVTSHP